MIFFVPVKDRDCPLIKERKKKRTSFYQSINYKLMFNYMCLPCIGYFCQIRLSANMDSLWGSLLQKGKKDIIKNLLNSVIQESTSTKIIF